jgi:hypothetical protein
MGAALIPLAIGSSVAGSAMQGEAAKYQGETEAAIHEYNAQVDEQEAGATAVAGAYEAAKLRDRMRKELARNQTIVAGSGFTMEGSPLDAQLGMIDEYAKDLGMMDYNTQIRSQQLVNKAKLFRYQAQVAKETGKIGVGQAFFGGVSDITKIGLMERMLRT